MKAAIPLTSRDADNIQYIFNKDISTMFELSCYGIIVRMNEDNLAKFLYYLPLDHYLRSRFQRAGEGVFKW